ncbi:MAG TPA: sodium:alanine symporter family protein [Firmicutes bacterium]|nr:sodium:alanine symporter family protein [Bacillota bacterium]
MTFLSNFYELIVTLVDKGNTLLWGSLLIILLIGLGIYFSIRTHFVQFRMIKEMVRLLGDGVGKSTKDGKISSFQAFCISTASRVGTGNIAGVAMAVAVGGPGSVFWMWVIALIGGASSFVESTLAQIYKVKDETGAYRGGPAYYIEQGLKQRWLGILFSVLITITFGFVFNAVQANTIAAAFETFGVAKWVMGAILAVVTAIIIFGGVQRIAKVSEVIVPVLAVAYIFVAIVVIVMNITAIPQIIGLIFSEAFNFSALASGAFGAMFIQGVKRGLFSNEAGMGSAPNAAATAEVSHPVKQGLIQTLGVFTDTIIICSCTAFVILISGSYSGTDLNGIQLTQHALTSQIGAFGGIFVAICILLFAFSSIVGNYYYGETNIEFLSTKKIYLTGYRIIVIAMVIFGSLTAVQFVWDLADLFMGLMAIVNLIAISLLGKFAFAALKDYTTQKKNGIKDPVFKASSIKGLENVEHWQE